MQVSTVSGSLPHMAYHEAFWLATAAAAPVIALANTVTLGDGIRLLNVDRSVRKRMGRFTWAYFCLFPLGLSAINYAAQTYVLVEALHSLAAGRDKASMTSATALVTYGLAYVALTAMLNGIARLLVARTARRVAFTKLRHQWERTEAAKARRGEQVRRAETDLLLGRNEREPNS